MHSAEKARYTTRDDENALQHVDDAPCMTPLSFDNDKYNVGFGDGAL